MASAINTKKRGKIVKRKNPVDSSESDEDANPVVVTRHSSRILDKQHKKKFTLPSRDAVWDTIPSVKSPPSLKVLKPRKAINNFTKVYNAYNYDDYEDTSESSFIEESSASDDQECQTQKVSRVKNYHKRVKAPETSSDDETLSPSACKQSTPPTDKEKPPESPPLSSSVGEEKTENLDELFTKDTSSGEDSECDLSPTKKRSEARRTVELESDEDVDCVGIETKEGENTSGSVSSDAVDTSDDDQKHNRAARLKQKQIDLFKQLKEAQERRKSNSK
ncbi:uncharacterized protein LOC131940681 isoform X2 [Physella acuta]|uniref:uncharacterized protein LOC131940681 isoform X2 n=1 Tax=Physella acuta TaxID=109671 RepID=UPI0027DC5DEA|nr:uncharacterized protein LOC131940681 isoform X2 [Physella acuta]